MRNGPKQTASLPRIFLLYVASDRKDAFLLKDSLEKYCRCEVMPTLWNEINSLIGATQETLARGSQLVLFVFSDAFLDALKKLSRAGKEERRLASLLIPSRFKKSKPHYKAVVLTHCTKMKELVARSTNYYANDPERVEEIPGLVNWISSAGLVRKAAVPIHAIMSVTQPASDPTASTALRRDRWYVPLAPEYNKDLHFVPGPGLPYQRTQEISGEEVFLHIYETFVNLQQGYVILHGAPGIGKTALAVQYMHEYSQKRGDQPYYRAVIWLDMSGGLEEDAFTDSDHYDDATVTTEFTLDQALVRLREIEEQDIVEKERWLLIIDRCNLELLEEIRRQLPLSSGKGDILIIMNSAPPIDKQLYTLKVLPLKEEYAIHLLQKSTMDFTNKNRESALKIVEDFHYHPLAIKNAGYRLNGLRDSNNKVDYKSFLADYNMSGDLKAFGRYKARLEKSFAFFIEELRKQEKQEKYLLLYCLMFAQKPLPEQLIRSIIVHVLRVSPEEEKRQFEQFKDILNRYSLLKESSEKWNADKDPLTAVEPIIVRQANEFLEEEVTREGEEEALKTKFVHAVSMALPRAKWDRYAAWPSYLPHVYRCIDKFKINNTMAAVRLYYMTGRFLHEHSLPVESASVKDAEEILYRARNICKELPKEKIEEGNDYPDFPTCESAIAELEHESLLDCVQRAEFDNKRKILLERYEKILHDIRSRPVSIAIQPAKRAFQNVDEVSVLNNLGRLYDDCGEYAEAEKRFGEALAKLGELRGKDALEIHLIRCEIMNNIALTVMKEASSKGGNEEENRNAILAEIKKGKEALDAVQVLISIRESDINNENFKRNFMLENAVDQEEMEAIIREYKRRYKECETQYELYKIYASMLSDVSMTYGEALYAEGDLKKAIKEANEAIEEAIRLFGVPSRVQYLSLLKRMINLAEFYRINAFKRNNRNEKIKEEKKAFGLYQKIGECIRTKFGKEKSIEINIPYYLKCTIIDNMQELMTQATNPENNDIDFCETLAEELEKPFFNVSVRGAR